jgi:biopolymer transport protein ExbD
MRVRHSTGGGDDKIELQMTPMIDIVFQLLVFFIMTFKIVSQEGDFNIKMPLAAPKEGLPDDLQLPPMKVRMTADGNGTLQSMSLNEKTFREFKELHAYIISIVGDARGPGSIQETAEVELDCDYNLKYEYVVEAITAVSGYVENDKVVKLVEKIKFSSPKGGPSG